MEPITEGCLLRIYISESDRYDGHPLDEAIVEALRTAGISGATVIRGIAGYGGSAVLHTTHVLRLSDDLPLVVEAVDAVEKIESILPHLDEIAPSALIVSQAIRVHPHTATG